MRLIDEVHLPYPFHGSWRLHFELKDRGHYINSKRAQRLMGHSVLYPKPLNSHPEKGHKIYTHLLRGLEIDRNDQVRANNTRDFPMANCFMCLVTIMDRHLRRVLSWRLSNTIDSSLCVEALQESLEHHGAPN